MSIAPCPPASPVAHGVVVFDPAAFKAAYPMFSTVSDPDLVRNFGFAQLQLNNSCKSAVKDAAKRETLLNLIVAHITQLLNGINGQPATGVVGRVSYAMEGSVMASVDMGSIVLGQAYWMQTQFGALFWNSTSIYRTFRYVPAPPVCADNSGYYGGPGYYYGNNGGW